MLESLIEYARAHGLGLPGFEEEIIHWVVSFRSDGSFAGDVLPLGLGDEATGSGKKSKRPAGRVYLVPKLDRNVLQGGGKSHFLWEGANVVLLVGDHPRPDKHEFFVKLIEEAARALPEASDLAVVARALRDPDTLAAIREAYEAAGGKPTDKVTLQVEGRVLLSPEAREQWGKWWQSKREALAKASGKKREGGERVCFATGELCQPTATHEKVGNLPGGQSSGSSLISFDKDAFESFGLHQSANCAVSERAAWAYTGALRDLLRTNAHDLGGVRVVYWYDRAVKREEGRDPLGFTLEVPGDDQTASLQALERLRSLLTAVQEGHRPPQLPDRYYAMVLSGTGGRAMVRDWIEGSFDDLLQKVVQWFDDLRIVTHNDVRQMTTPPKLNTVLTSLLRPRPAGQGYEDWVRPLGEARMALWKSAITGAPIGYGVLARAVLRESAFRVSCDYEALRRAGQQPKEKPGALVAHLHARMGLMKAYHLRMDRAKGGSIMSESIQRGLNPGHPSPAYQCGRLMALYARLQEAALGNVGADVIQRYYSAASATPARVLGALDRLSRAHMGKLAHDRPKLAHWYENRLAEVWSRLGDTVPATLSVVEQSLFALGYYHQLAELLTKKATEQTVEEAGGEETVEA